MCIVLLLEFLSVGCWHCVLKSLAEYSFQVLQQRIVNWTYWMRELDHCWWHFRNIVLLHTVVSLLWLYLSCCWHWKSVLLLCRFWKNLLCNSLLVVCCS